MKKQQPQTKKMHIGIIPMTLILAVITLIFIMTVNKMSQPSSINKIGVEAPVKQNTEKRITSKEDLDEVLKELDSNNPNGLNSDLNSLSSESSGF